MTGSSRAVFILKFFGISESACLVLKTAAQPMFVELQSRRTVFNTDKTSEGFSFFLSLNGIQNIIVAAAAAKPNSNLIHISNLFCDNRKK